VTCGAAFTAADFLAGTTAFLTGGAAFFGGAVFFAGLAIVVVGVAAFFTGGMVISFEGLGAGNLLALVRFGQPTHCTMDGLDGDDGHRHRSAGDRLIDTLSALPYQFQLKWRALVEDQIIDLTAQIVSAVAGRNPRQTFLCDRAQRRIPLGERSACVMFPAGRGNLDGHGSPPGGWGDDGSCTRRRPRRPCEADHSDPRRLLLI
jgi:hypothetical protein